MAVRFYIALVNIILFFYVEAMFNIWLKIDHQQLLNKTELLVASSISDFVTVAAGAGGGMNLQQ